MDFENSDIKMSNIGSNLKYFRKLRRITQKAVAEQACISLRYYQSIESTNDESPSLDTLMKICFALNVPIDFIVKDCGIELFADYTNYYLLKTIQGYDRNEKQEFSKWLLCMYEMLIKSDGDFDLDSDPDIDE